VRFHEHTLVICKNKHKEFLINHNWNCYRFTNNCITRCTSLECFRNYFKWNGSTLNWYTVTANSLEYFLWFLQCPEDVLACLWAPPSKSAADTITTRRHRDATLGNQDHCWSGWECDSGSLRDINGDGDWNLIYLNLSHVWACLLWSEVEGAGATMYTWADRGFNRATLPSWLLYPHDGFPMLMGTEP